MNAPARLEPSEAAAIVWLERELKAGLEARTEVGVDGWQVATAVAFRLGPSDLLRSDLAVLREPGGATGLGGSHDPAAALLLIEVARGRSSHESRAPLYAAAGAKELWLLDIRRGWTEVLRSPWRGLYRSRTLWYPGEPVPVSLLPGLEVEAMPRT